VTAAPAALDPPAESLFGDTGLIIHARSGRTLDDLDPGLVMGLFRDHGVLVLRGFAADRAAFERFTRLFARDFVLPMMRVARPKVSGAPDAMTAHVDVGSHAMGLHQELSFTPMRPEAIWLWCETTACVHGETTIADGRRLYEALPGPLKQLFASRPLEYVFAGPPESVAELFRVERADLPMVLDRPADGLRCRARGDLLEFKYRTSALQKAKFGGATTFANFLLFSQTAVACGHPEGRRIMGMLRFADGELIPPELVAEIEAIAAPLTGEIRWHSGDLAMIDNTRMMHGRRAFDADGERTVYYRAARELRPTA